MLNNKILNSRILTKTGAIFVDMRDSTKLFSKEESVIIEDFNGWINNGMNEIN